MSVKAKGRPPRLDRIHRINDDAMRKDAQPRIEPEWTANYQIETVARRQGVRQPWQPEAGHLQTTVISPSIKSPDEVLDIMWRCRLCGDE